MSASSLSCNVLVIDFMNLLVRAWHAGKPSESHAVLSMFRTVASAVRTTRPTYLIFAMDGGYVHRTEILPSYKSHRPAMDPDLQRQRQLAEDAIQAAGLCAVRMDGFEADDVIASICASHEEVVICSGDKDLLSLSVNARVYHPWGSGKFVRAEDVLGVSPEQVCDFLALCGDTTDGVPGVKGVGPKTAQDLLTKFGTLEHILCAARSMRISGAAGKNLSAGIADALISQQLVTLVCNLPLPELAPWRPKTGWQQTLTAMRLGSVAAVLESLTMLPRAGGAESGARVAPDSESGSVAPRRQMRSLFDDLTAETTEENPKSESIPLSAGTVKPERGCAESVDRAPLNVSDQEYGSPGCAVTSTDSIGTSGGSNALISADAVTSNYQKAGFKILREFEPVPGTNMKPKHLAVWQDGSRWILDQNSRSHICCSDSPVTEWKMDRRGPINPATNSVRKAT